MVLKQWIGFVESSIGQSSPLRCPKYKLAVAGIQLILHLIIVPCESDGQIEAVLITEYEEFVVVRV